MSDKCGSHAWIGCIVKLMPHKVWESLSSFREWHCRCVYFENRPGGGCCCCCVGLHAFSANASAQFRALMWALTTKPRRWKFTDAIRNMDKHVNLVLAQIHQRSNVSPYSSASCLPWHIFVQSYMLSFPFVHHHPLRCMSACPALHALQSKNQTVQPYAAREHWINTVLRALRTCSCDLITQIAKYIPKSSRAVRNANRVIRLH